MTGWQASAVVRRLASTTQPAPLMPSTSREIHPAQSDDASADEGFTVSLKNLLDLIWIRFLNQPDRVVFRVPDHWIEAHRLHRAAVDASALRDAMCGGGPPHARAHIFDKRYGILFSGIICRPAYASLYLLNMSVASDGNTS